jgi:hypothetical protein
MGSIQSIDLNSVVPKNAEIFTMGNGQEAIFPVDLDGDGQQGIMVYLLIKGKHPGCEQCRSAKIMVLRSGERLQKLWESEDIDGNYWEFPPTGLRDINADGKVELVAFCAAGAAGGILNFYTWDGRGFTKLDDPWNQIGGVDSVKFEDLDGDKIDEVIIGHSTGAHLWNQGLPDIYKWTGKTYRRSNADFPHYYRSRILECKETLNSGDPRLYTTTLGAVSAKLLIQGHYYQRDYDRLYETHKKLLSFGEDYRDTRFGTKEETAAIDVIVGDYYLRDGNSDEALKVYEMALRYQPESESIKQKIKRVKESRK